METGTTYWQLMNMLNTADELIQKCTHALIELIGEHDAREDIAILKRSQFILTTNDVAPMRAAEPEKQSKWSILTLTEKEILKMPKNFRKQFRAGKILAHVRKKNSGIYEIRCQINKHPISASSKDFGEAKRKFTEKLNEFWSHLSLPAKPAKVSKSITLGAYMLQWLETVKKPYVKPITYKDYLLTYKANIYPAFGERPLNEITQFELQAFLNSYTEQGKNRTAKKLFQILGAIFDYAIIDDIITKSPMQRVVLPRYEQKQGVPLSRAEEKQLVDALLLEGDAYSQAFVFLIYTGLRRAELATVTVADGWASLITAKQRKGYKEKMRNVPISPMLERMLPFIDIETIKELSVELLTKYFKKMFPSHHLHDTRHTFITRAQECGIPRELVSLWAGHAADNSTTTLVYTHLGQNKDLQIKEIQKFSYDL